MILNDVLIRQLCRKKGASLLEPFNEYLLNGASYDVRIGDSAKLVTESGYWEIDLSKSTEDDPYVLHPGQYILVATWEKFNVPKNLCGVFYLKSSRAREFFGHQLATFIDPGYSNAVMTLELVNNHPYQAKKLYKGLRIGQVVFQQLTGRATKSYDKFGSYNNASEVQSSNKEAETNYLLNGLPVTPQNIKPPPVKTPKKDLTHRTSKSTDVIGDNWFSPWAPPPPLVIDVAFQEFNEKQNHPTLPDYCTWGVGRHFT